MLDGILAHSTRPIMFELDGITHELLIVTRLLPIHLWGDDFAEAMDSDPEVFGKIVIATIGCWARAWQAITTEAWQVSGYSAIEQHGLEPNTDMPYVTVQNKDYNGMTLTVHSFDNGSLALLTAGASLYAVDAIRAAKPGIISMKGMSNEPKPKPQKKQAPPPKEPSHQSLDEFFGPPHASEDVPMSDNVIPASQMEPNPTGVINLLGWHVVGNMGNSGLVLPMLKKSALSKATYATRNVSQDKEERYAVQYQDKDLVAYYAHKIERVQLGESMALKVHTQRGDFVIWQLQKNGEESYDFQAAQKYLARIGIDVLQPFVLQQKFVYVVKINHSGENEYKNCYGFWREADSGNAQSESVTDVTPDSVYDDGFDEFDNTPNDIPF